ncbi:hypothetical protein KM043_011738 [Ampulex compressa]|nr:hypothetical protein KM043_011738 [Ampulex compressa]
MKAGAWGFYAWILGILRRSKRLEMMMRKLENGSAFFLGWKELLWVLIVLVPKDEGRLLGILDLDVVLDVHFVEMEAVVNADEELRERVSALLEAEALFRIFFARSSYDETRFSGILCLDLDSSRDPIFEFRVKHISNEQSRSLASFQTPPPSIFSFDLTDRSSNTPQSPATPATITSQQASSKEPQAFSRPPKTNLLDPSPMSKAADGETDDGVAQTLGCVLLFFVCPGMCLLGITENHCWEVFVRASRTDWVEERLWLLIENDGAHKGRGAFDRLEGVSGTIVSETSPLLAASKLGSSKFEPRQGAASCLLNSATESVNLVKIYELRAPLSAPETRFLAIRGTEFHKSSRSSVEARRDSNCRSLATAECPKEASA